MHACHPVSGVAIRLQHTGCIYHVTPTRMTYVRKRQRLTLTLTETIYTTPDCHCLTPHQHMHILNAPNHGRPFIVY